VLGIGHARHPPHGVLVAALQVDVQRDTTRTEHNFTQLIGRQPSWWSVPGMFILQCHLAHEAVPSFSQGHAQEQDCGHGHCVNKQK